MTTDKSIIPAKSKLKTVSLCKTPLPYIALMHTLPLFYPTPCMPSPCSIPPHACPPLVLSHPMHALPLFYPSPCMTSPYSIPLHACSPAILSHAMHTSPYSIPPHACHPPILSKPMHTLPLFYFTPCMPYLYSIPPYACPLPAHTSQPVFCSIPAHACPNWLSCIPWRHVSPSPSEFATFKFAHTEYIIIIYLVIYLV